jgi:hypothetical protein
VPQEYLTTNEFRAWAAGIDRRLDEALALRLGLEATRKTVAVLADRSNRLERDTAHAKTLAGVIGAAVSAAISGLTLVFHR